MGKQHEKDEPKSFIMFSNNEKQSETQPDYTGHIILEDGTKMRLAAWTKDWSKDGKSGTLIGGKMSPFMTKEENEQKKQEWASKSNSQQPANVEEDLPF